MIRMSWRQARRGDAQDPPPESLEEESSLDDRTPETGEGEADAGDNAATTPSVDDSEEDPTEDTVVDGTERQSEPAGPRWQRVVAFGLLPGLAILLAGGVGYLKWQQISARETQSARIESVQAATESTIKILSYSPDSVDHDLDSARERLTGKFRDAYIQLTHDVVIPGSKEKKISAVATVPAATSISATPSHAVVMVFVNQSIMVANDPPSSTASTVRVTMDKHDNRWLISDFTPI
jgi:Mce-associated membrane protein